MHKDGARQYWENIPNPIKKRRTDLDPDEPIVHTGAEIHREEIQAEKDAD